MNRVSYSQYCGGNEDGATFARINKIYTSDLHYEFNINLNAGWNLISSNILPDDLNISNIFSDINSLIVVKNDSGQIYSRIFGINQIGNWQIQKGYQVYVTTSELLKIVGTEVNPESVPINLNTGWNLISYLRKTPVEIDEAFTNLFGNLITAKDGNGKIFTTDFAINQIKELVPGCAYWLYMSSPATLIYKENDNYKNVYISSQTWMDKNLDVVTYRNGDTIPEVSDPSEWANLTTGAWCYYNNNPENGKAYGKLYNWYAVNDPRGLAPEGLHIPSDNEWSELINNLGGELIAGAFMKDFGTDFWLYPNTGALNESGFSALPSGFRNPFFGTYLEREYFGNWWSSTDENSNKSFARRLSYNNTEAQKISINKRCGLAVRCVKNSNLLSPVYLAFPGNNSLNQPISIELAWQPLDNALTYNLQISYDPNFSDIVLNDSGITSSKYQINNLYYGSNYYWRVCSKNDFFISDWSKIWNFRTISDTIIKDTVKIGQQIWMARNLDVVTYRNGDTIPQITDRIEWITAKSGAWCYYNNDPANKEVYGRFRTPDPIMKIKELGDYARKD